MEPQRIDLDRRAFLKGSVLSAAGLAAGATPLAAAGTMPFRAASAGDVPEPAQQAGEVLYNGIQLPRSWPPRTMERRTYNPLPVPYLAAPPAVIPITVGRQLFVDDFLIAQTTLARRYHRARKHAANPVMKAETALEKGAIGLPVACPKSGGVWWDPADQRFKAWYEAAWLGSMAYATSRDGLVWERPALDVVPGTNALVPGLRPDSTTVFLDHDARDPAQRFKMFVRGPNAPSVSLEPGASLVSADGIHWSQPVATGDLGDRSTMFYNPFRKKWVYSIRSSGRLGSRQRGRARWYREHDDFLQGASWTDDDLVFWAGADALDPVDPAIGDRVQLYNLDAVAYESIMLGMHQIHLGPHNRVCQEGGFPKCTELTLSYSRDGFHWHRPDRSAFIAASRRSDAWDRGYVQSVGGICLIRGDELWFPYIGFQGDPTNTHEDWRLNGMYANGAMGMAVLRRDGFVSMAAGRDGGTLTTRPVTFAGNHLFVNANCPQGDLRVEVLDGDGQPLAAFSRAHCEKIAVDSTIHRVRWSGDPDLGELAGKPVRLRFHLSDGEMFAFWVTPDAAGASHGYTAAGGPGFTGARDTGARA